MQKIEYRESPSPHVIVENFIPSAAARDCLAEAQALEPVYRQAMVVGEVNGHATVAGDELGHTDCPDCAAEQVIMKNSVRQNKIVYLDEYYEGRRQESKILQHLEQALKLPGLLDAFQSFPNMFPIITQTTHMETMISSYGKCDFYGFHKDALSWQPSTRILTCVLHWNTEPKQYEGGELILTGKTIEDQYAHEPFHNTAVFFESNKVVHAVDETRFDGLFEDSRFSINLWLGFEHRRMDSYGNPVDTEVFWSHKYR